MGHLLPAKCLPKPFLILVFAAIPFAGMDLAPAQDFSEFEPVDWSPPSGVVELEPERLVMGIPGRVPKRIRTGEVATLSPRDLLDYNRQPRNVQRMISAALDLTRQGLGYRFGSADPERGGMDCSGAINYVLRASGYAQAPRTSFDLYKWLSQYRTLQVVDGPGAWQYRNDQLRPGDLLFWIHTYRTKRRPPITHVAIYIGRDKRTGKHLMVHAGHGGQYAGRKRNGVTVVEFEEPAKRGFNGGKGSFVGYGTIPGAR